MNLFTNFDIRIATQELNHLLKAEQASVTALRDYAQKDTILPFLRQRLLDHFEDNPHKLDDGNDERAHRYGA